MLLISHFQYILSIYHFHPNFQTSKHGFFFQEIQKLQENDKIFYVAKLKLTKCIILETYPNCFCHT